MSIKLVSGIPVLIVALVLLSGCGGGDSFDRVPLAGTITVDGNDKPSGGITATADLKSSGDDAPELPNAYATIVDGKYEFNEDSQPGVGAYIFEISIFVPEEGAANETSTNPEYANETGSNSVLYKKKVQVPEGGSDSFSIELTKNEQTGQDDDPRGPSGERER